MLFERCYGYSCAGVKFPIAFLRFTRRATPFGEGDHLHQTHAATDRQGEYVPRCDIATGAPDTLAIAAYMTFFDKLASRAAGAHEAQEAEQTVDPQAQPCFNSSARPEKALPSRGGWVRAGR